MQEQGAWPTIGARTNIFRPRLMYRNVTTISSAFRVSGVVTAEGREAPRPALGYDPAARSSTLFVNTALIHYRPSAAIELAFGRDELPTGVNVPDLAAYFKSRNRLGYYDAPTQLKLFWSAKRYHITPFVYAPGGNEPTGEHESGGGSLAEVDLIGNQRLIGGMTILRGTAANGDRRTVGAYARLGFGQWGHPRRARRHRSDENSADYRRVPADGEGADDGPDEEDHAKLQNGRREANGELRQQAGLHELFGELLPPSP